MPGCLTSKLPPQPPVQNPPDGEQVQAGGQSAVGKCCDHNSGRAPCRVQHGPHSIVEHRRLLVPAGVPSGGIDERTRIDHDKIAGCHGVPDKRRQPHILGRTWLVVADDPAGAVGQGDRSAGTDGRCLDPVIGQ